MVLGFPSEKNAEIGVSLRSMLGAGCVKMKVWVITVV